MSIHLTRALEMVELCGKLGLVPVPRIPTPEMINAGLAVLEGDPILLSSAYTSMIDAGSLA